MGIVSGGLQPIVSYFNRWSFQTALCDLTISLLHNSKHHAKATAAMVSEAINAVQKP